MPGIRKLIFQSQLLQQLQICICGLLHRKIRKQILQEQKHTFDDICIAVCVEEKAPVFGVAVNPHLTLTSPNQMVGGSFFFRIGWKIAAQLHQIGISLEAVLQLGEFLR